MVSISVVRNPCTHSLKKPWHLHVQHNMFKFDVNYIYYMVNYVSLTIIHFHTWLSQLKIWVFLTKTNRKALWEYLFWKVLGWFFCEMCTLKDWIRCYWSNFIITEDRNASSINGYWGVPYPTQLKNCKNRKLLLIHYTACMHWTLWKSIWTNIFRENIEVEIPGGKMFTFLYSQFVFCLNFTFQHSMLIICLVIIVWKLTFTIWFIDILWMRPIKLKIFMYSMNNDNI